MRHWMVSGSALALVALQSTAQPVFTDRAEDLGLTHAYTGGWEHFVGGGVASFDCNGDQLPELYIAGGEAPAVLLHNTTSARGADIALHANTPAALNLTGVIGAYPLDIDSDGMLDLFVLRVGENKLLKGGPDCSFTAFELPGFEGGNRWTTAFSATWEAGNDLPTLAIGNYVDRTDPDGPFEACDQNILLRPVEGVLQMQVLEPAACPLSMLFSDWNRKGKADLRVSNDRHYYVREGAEQLWAMEDAPRLYTQDEGWANYSIWGMGIASRDISGDGIPEVFLTSMGDQKLQVRDMALSGPHFREVVFGKGTTAHRPYTGGDGRPSTGWHVEFGDMDNDGLDDVFIAKGNVDEMPDSAMFDPNNLLMQNPDATFSERGLEAGIASNTHSRGGALVDMNLDGALDIIVVNRFDPVEVFQNIAPESGNWVLLDIAQSGVNTQAVGAWVEITDGVKTQVREITVGGGHASGNASLMHFGLGENEQIKVRVIWPDGVISDWVEIKANQILDVTRQGNSLLVAPL